MTRYLIWRVAQFPLVLAVIYLLTFLLVWVAPGSPFQQTDRKLDPVVERQLREQYHAESAWDFLGHSPWAIVRHGDFGPSMTHRGWSVGQILAVSLPVSVTLGLFALTIATLGGCALGTAAAAGRGGPIAGSAAPAAPPATTLPGSTTPARLLLAVFSDRLHLLPGVGWGGLRHLLLPAVALSLAPLAYIAQLTRVSMLDVLGDDYVRTARAKGLSRTAVIWRHCFRNAVLPVFTYLGPAAAAALTGSFVVEQVFNLPGLGQHFVDGVKNRDQTLILGTVMVYSVFLLGLNLLVDVGYVFIDPRIDLTTRRR